MNRTHIGTLVLGCTLQVIPYEARLVGVERLVAMVALDPEEVLSISTFRGEFVSGPRLTGDVEVWPPPCPGGD